MLTIGIFDSGIGGKQFARELTKQHPDYAVTIVHDRKHLPYGDKSPEQIQAYTEQAIQPLLGYDVVVLACNTATAYAIDYLRSLHPNQLFVGFEPAIKLAVSATKTNKIAVLATPATLRSARYHRLRTEFGQGIQIFEPNVSRLAHQIELQNVDWKSLQALIENLIHQGVDQIVLGCTHYHLIQNTLRHFAADKADIITPTGAVIARINSLR